MILGATIRLKDEFSGTLGKAARETTGLTGKMRILGHMVAKPTIRVKDDASATISKVKGSLMSLRTVAGLALAGLGINELKEATVGAAMTWETQAVSMEHWLKGNKTLAKEATGWLEDFAAATPFEMTDLFPAMTRGIGVSDGNLKRAERLVTLAADMAALTPGKSISDAMEALADAKMGEFERLKEFNMKMTQEEFRALGGFGGMLSKAEATFAGGAEKLSQTAIGKISTITDNMKSMFRSTGMGILDSMKPRLDKITSWFDKNKETVARWKDNLITFGREASEALFSRFESVFRYIRTRYLDNPSFTNLDFWGKVNFIMTDLTTGFKTWLNSGGADAIKSFGMDVGSFIGEGIATVAPSIGRMAAQGVLTAFSEALKSNPLGAVIIGAIGGAGIGSAFPVVGTGVGAGLGAISGGVTWGANKAWNFGIELRQKHDQVKGFKPITPTEAIIGQRYSRSHASGLLSVPYDNYLASLHRGESVLTRAEADNYRKNQRNALQQIFYVTINGVNKTTKQIFDEIMDYAESAGMNMGTVK